jgi:hypothetical protein
VVFPWSTCAIIAMFRIGVMRMESKVAFSLAAQKYSLYPG